MMKINDLSNAVNILLDIKLTNIIFNKNTKISILEQKKNNRKKLYVKKYI